MNFNIIVVSFFVLIISGVTINQAYGQVDPLIEIDFLQLGLIYSSENQFHISNDMNIREFSNGNIIRISGQTIEGFPYITYSKISDEKIYTSGVIFVNNQFVKLSFVERPIQIEKIDKKNNDIDIVVQYTQRAHSKQFIFIDIKIFDKEQNTYIDYNQNYGYVSNTNVNVNITNENKQEIFSSTGITDDKGLFETKYLIPDNSKRETLTITINAENENSISSKILQVFALGNISSNSGGP